jgi:hypothetical protein
LVEVGGLALGFPVLGSYFPGEVSLSGGIYPIAYFAFSAIYLIYSIGSRIRAKVRTIRFYEGFIEMSGWKFKKQFAYQDISSLSKRIERATFFSEEQVSFRIGDELFLFRFKNHRNKNLGVDLYSWMSRKVPTSALSKPVSAFEN